jgi:hypothetical protein
VQRGFAANSDDRAAISTGSERVRVHLKGKFE